MNFNTEILRILKQQNIRSVKDIDNYISHSIIDKKDAVCGREETWVEDIVNIIKEDMKLCSEEKYVTFSNDSDEFPCLWNYRFSKADPGAGCSRYFKFKLDPYNGNNVLMCILK